MWARLLVIFGVVLMVLSAGTLVLGRVLISRYTASIHQEKLLPSPARKETDGRPPVTGPFNFLLVGSDFRDYDPEQGERADSIIILHVTRDLGHAYLISVPRDLLVDIPPWPANGFGGAHDKINASYQFGGPGGPGGFGLLAQTLTDLTGVHFDGAAIIRFTGFQKVVDALGGVYMCVDVRTTSIHTGAVYEVGCRDFRPWEALDYVRQRKSLEDGDYGRQRHQQQFLKAIFSQATSRGVISDPGKLDAVIRAAGDTLTVDSNGVPPEELIFAFRNFDVDNLLGLRVPSNPQMIGGVSYVVAEPGAADLWRAIRDESLDSYAAEHPELVNPLG